MKAPDKIYLREYKAGGLSQVWSGIKPTEETIIASHEYIRKEALLEWAKEQKEDCERVIREHPEDESLWYERDKYAELIDKLNSMT